GEVAQRDIDFEPLSARAVTVSPCAPTWSMTARIRTPSNTSTPSVTAVDVAISWWANCCRVSRDKSMWWSAPAAAMLPSIRRLVACEAVSARAGAINVQASAASNARTTAKWPSALVNNCFATSDLYETGAGAPQAEPPGGRKSGCEWIHLVYSHLTV